MLDGVQRVVGRDVPCFPSPNGLLIMCMKDDKIYQVSERGSSVSVAIQTPENMYYDRKIDDIGQLFLNERCHISTVRDDPKSSILMCHTHNDERLNEIEPNLRKMDKLLSNILPFYKPE